MSGLLTYSQHTSHPTAPTTGNHHLYFYSDGKLYRMDSTGTPVEVGAAGGGGGLTVVTLGSDVATTSTGYGDVTGLSFAVTSGTAYRFSAFIPYTAALDGVGNPVTSQWALNGPALTRGAWRVKQDGQTGSYDTVPGSVGATGVAVIDGYMLPSASGTLVVRFKTGTFSYAITAKTGSTITYW